MKGKARLHEFYSCFYDLSLFSSKLEKADILEKAVLYVNELESHTKTVHHEKIRAFQQGYLQACHELVELISQQSNCLQSSNSTDLKQKLRQTIDKHLTGRCTVDQQQAVPTPILMNANPGFQMQLGPNRLNAMGRVIPPPTNLPFMMPPPFNLNCLARLPMQSSTSSSSLFPFQATPFIRPVPLQSGHSVTQPSQQLNTATVPEEEIDVERVEEERNGGINTTTEDSGVESPTTKSAEVWRPFEVF